MTNLPGKQASKPSSSNRCESLIGIVLASIGKVTKATTVLAALVCMAAPVGAQKTEQTRQTTIVQDMATVQSVPATQLEFVGQEAYEVKGAKGIRFKLSVTNRAKHPDFLWHPTAKPCGKLDTASRTWVEIFGSPGDKRLNGFCGLSSSADLGQLWFVMPSGEKGPPCVYLVMTDRQTGRKYTSNRVCSRSFTVVKGSSTGTASSLPRVGWEVSVDQSAGYVDSGVRVAVADVDNNGSQGSDRIFNASRGQTASGSAQGSGRIRAKGAPDLRISEYVFSLPNNDEDVKVFVVTEGETRQAARTASSFALVAAAFKHAPGNYNNLINGDKVVLVHVVNAGNQATTPCRLRLTVRKINGVAVGREKVATVSALAPGQDVWILVDATSILPNNIKLDATTFKLNVDATNLLKESNEANNEAWHNQ